MTIFLHGADSYRRTKRLREAVRQFVARYPGAGIRRFDAAADGDAADRVAEVLSSTSLFAPRTLVILDSALELTPGQVKALVARTASSEREHLVLVAETDKPAKTYARLAEDDVKQEAFPQLVGEPWVSWVAREAQARSCPLSAADVRALAAAFTGDSWGAATELDVLAAMPAEMRRERLAESAGRARGSASWADLRRLCTGNPAARLAILARLEATGDAPAKLFAMAAHSADPHVAARGDLAVKTGGWDFEEALLALAVY